MKRFKYYLIVLSGAALIYNAETLGQKTSPKVDIKVNREFDEKGNLKRYDSTYSYSWTGSKNSIDSADENLPGMRENNFSMRNFFHYYGDDSFIPIIDTLSQESDSIFTYNNPHYTNNDSLNFWNDRSFFYDFFNHQFGSKPFSHDDFINEFMMQHKKMMEELQNSFFDEFEAIPFEQDSVPSENNLKQNQNYSSPDTPAIDI